MGDEQAGTIVRGQGRKPGIQGIRLHRQVRNRQEEKCWND